MLFIVKFEDHQDQPQLRAEHLRAHIEWLDRHSATVLVGGPLRKELGHNPLGGLWIVAALSKQEIMDLVLTDPFSKVGLRKDVKIFHWSKAFEDRQVLV